MTLDTIARSISARGRNGDDTLLHVNRDELAGLQGMMGVPLTRHPETGLPEAFNWRKIKRTVLPLAGAAVGSFFGPVGAGVGAGLGTYAATKNLQQGIMSGLTAWGGATLIGGMAGPTGSSAANAAGGSGTVVGTANTGNLFNPVSPTETLSAASKNFVASGGNALIDVAAQNKLAAGAAAIGGYNALGGFDAPTGTPMDLASASGSGWSYDPSDYPENFPDDPRVLVMPTFDDDDEQDEKEYRYFQAGGDVSSFDPEAPVNTAAPGGIAPAAPIQGDAQMQLVTETKMAILGQHPKPEVPIQTFIQTFGKEAFQSFRTEVIKEMQAEAKNPSQPPAYEATAHEGTVTGPGTGVSDDIPANIDGQEEVRLSDGEFVVPADVVSSLGDGSTEAGSERLHGMMDEVRQQKTGKKAQPRPMAGILPR